MKQIDIPLVTFVFSETVCLREYTNATKGLLPLLLALNYWANHSMLQRNHTSLLDYIPCLKEILPIIITPLCCRKNHRQQQNAMTMNSVAITIPQWISHQRITSHYCLQTSES
jgi:hypothetical protein